MKRLFLTMLIAVLLVSTCAAQMSGAFTGTLNGHGLTVNVGAAWSTYLMNLKVGGTSMFSVDQTGAVTAAGVALASKPAQVKTVGASGCDYTTITAALTAITDAATNKRYTVLIYPGTYSENVTCKQYVSVCGVSRDNVIITASGADGTPVVTLASNMELSTLSVVATNALGVGVGGTATGSIVCDVTGTALQWPLSIAGTDCIVSNCAMNGANPFWVSGDRNVITNNTCDWTSSTAVGNCLGAFDIADGRDFIISGNSIKITYTGTDVISDQYVFHLCQGGHRIAGNTIEIVGTRPVAYIFNIDKDWVGEDGDTVYVENNSIRTTTTHATPTRTVVVGYTFATGEVLPPLWLSNNAMTATSTNAVSDANYGIRAAGDAVVCAITTDEQSIRYGDAGITETLGSMTRTWMQQRAPLASPSFTGTMTIGAADTNLYRESANVLKTDDAFKTAANLYVGGNAQLGSDAGATHLIYGELDSMNVSDDIPLHDGTTIDGVRPSTHAHTGVGGGGTITAGSITNVPAGNIAAVTAQAAVNEVDNEKRAWKPEDVLDYPQCGVRKVFHRDALNDPVGTYVFYQGAGEAGVVRNMWLITLMNNDAWSDLKTYDMRLRIYPDCGTVTDFAAHGLTPAVDIPLDVAMGAVYHEQDLTAAEVNQDAAGIIRARATYDGDAFSSFIRIIVGDSGNGKSLAIPYSNGCLIQFWSTIAGGAVAPYQLNYSYVEYDDGPLPTFPYSSWRLRSTLYSGTVADDATATFLPTVTGSGLVVGSFLSADAATDMTFNEDNVIYAVDGVAGAWECSSLEDYFDQPFYFLWGASIRGDVGCYYVDRAADMEVEAYRWLGIPFATSITGTWTNSGQITAQNVTLDWLTLYYN